MFKSMDNCVRSKCDHFGDAFGSLVIQKLAEMVAAQASICIWRVDYNAPVGSMVANNRGSMKQSEGSSIGSMKRSVR